MTKAASVKLAEFEMELVRQLNLLGTFATLDFHVPGTRTRLDVYIASPARAFVEIKSHGPRSALEARSLLGQAESIRRQFGEEINPILIILGKLPISQKTRRELYNSGFLVLHASCPGPASVVARQCAEEIRKFLFDLPYRFTKKRPAESIEPNRPAPLPENVLYDRADRLRVAEWDLNVDEDEAKSDGTEYDRPDIFGDVLVSLESVLSAEQFLVLKAELSAFDEEYDNEHYTACALRIGRTLEHVVYALAVAWGVQVNRTTLKLLSNLEGSFAQLSEAVITYATAIDRERPNRKRQVEKQFEQVNTNLTKILLELDALTPTSTDVPLNVESIIRDIRKQFTRVTKVRTGLDYIIDKQILRRILEARNNAAHASTNGERRELKKSEVDTTVELLRTALFWFGNVAFAMAEKDAPAD